MKRAAIAKRPTAPASRITKMPAKPKRAPVEDMWARMARERREREAREKHNGTASHPVVAVRFTREQLARVDAVAKSFAPTWAQNRKRGGANRSDVIRRAIESGLTLLEVEAKQLAAERKARGY